MIRRFLPPVGIDSQAQYRWLLAGYTCVLYLYPPSYRTAFSDEMHAVFAEALSEATAQGWCAQWVCCWRELRDLPRLLFTEYWHVAQQWLALRLQEDDPLGTDLPGVVPVGYGSLPHALFIVAGRNPRLRRFLDITIATVGILLIAPFLLLLSIFIKLESRGPIFYRQRRLGKGGAGYTMYKFRSMYVNPPAQTVVERETEPTSNPRITRMGRLTRRWHLDEMPQVFNVLKGDMSVFGPRPPMPE